MSEGQGSVTYSGPPSSGGGGGAVAGARNGASLDGITDVVLGQDPGAIGNPAALLNDRVIPMQQHTIDFIMPGPPQQIFSIGQQGAAPPLEGIPTMWLSDDSSNWEAWQPANYLTGYGAFGTQARWNAGYSIYPGVNEPVTARPNVVGAFWQYNQDYTQGRLIGGEAAFRWATESYFIIGSDPYFEFHTPEIYTDTGTIFRLDSTYVRRDNGIGFREFVMDNNTWFSTGFNPSGGLYYALLEYNSTSDLAAMAFHCQFPGGVAAIGFNNNTTGSIGTITNQDGLMDVNALVDIDLRSPRVIMDSSNYGNIVNPTISSYSNLDTPGGDALFEVRSTTQGFRLPTMTTAQRNAIATEPGVPGLIICNSDTLSIDLWTGVAWVAH